MGKIDWKWLIIGGIVGYIGAAYAPKLLSRVGG